MLLPSGHKYYLNVIWMFNFGRNILDQLWTFQQCSGPNIPGVFLFYVIWIFNFDWNIMHQKWTFLQPSGRNIQIWHYINIKLRYFLFHENWIVTMCFHCTDNFQCSDKIQNPNDSISIQLWTFYKHSHLNIHTILILNYEGIIFECSPKHSWNVPWMLPCPLGEVAQVKGTCPLDLGRYVT